MFMAPGMVFMQTFNTSGDTTVPMIVTLISIWLVQQPLALVMPGLDRPRRVRDRVGDQHRDVRAVLRLLRLLPVGALDDQKRVLGVRVAH